MTAPSSATLSLRVNAMAAALAAVYTDPGTVGKAYEAYLWVAAVKAAEDATGSAATLVDLDGGRIRLPGRPIPFPATGYTRAEVDSIEVHAGREVRGRSGVAHELDVAVITRSSADRARQLGRALPSSAALIALEAKCYAGTLGKILGRQTLGLNSDLFRTRVRLVSNSESTDVSRLLRGRTRKARLWPRIQPSIPGREALLVRGLSLLIDELR